MTEEMSWDERREEAIDLMDGGLGVTICFVDGGEGIDIVISRWNWKPMQRARVAGTIRAMLVRSLLLLEPHGRSGAYRVSEVRR